MTRLVPLAVLVPAVFPEIVWKKLCAEFQSLGRTIFVAAIVVVEAWELNPVNVPVKSPIVSDLT